MYTSRINIKFLIIITLVLLTFIPVSLFSTSARASFQRSQMVTKDGSPLSSREIDEIKVKRLLEQKLVSEKLKESGLSKQQVVNKMDKMTRKSIRLPHCPTKYRRVVTQLWVRLSVYLLLSYLYCL